MTRKKIQLEYPLNNISEAILWDALSTETGLQKWMAEKVEAKDRTFTFTWSPDEIRTAEMTQCRLHSHVRFHWTDDEDTKSFFEFRIARNELTGDYTLLVTDFVEEEEEEEMIEIWDFEISTLQRICGI